MYIAGLSSTFSPSRHVSLLNLVCQRRAEAPGLTDDMLRGLQPGALEGSLQEVAQWLEWETWSVLLGKKHQKTVDCTL